MAARCVTSSSIQQNRFSKLSIQRNARQVQRCVLARGGAVTELNTIEAYKEFIEHDGVVVIDFFVSFVFSNITPDLAVPFNQGSHLNFSLYCDVQASWCAPCKLIAPKIEEMAAELTDVKFGKVRRVERFFSLAPYYQCSLPF